MGSDYDIIILTETWLNDGISDEELFPNTYMVYRKDRNSANTGRERGGGVLIAVKSCYQSSLYVLPDTCVEELWTDVSIQGSHCIIGTVYIPPSSSLATYESHIESINNIKDKLPNAKVIVAGDYNLPGFVNSFKSFDRGHYGDLTPYCTDLFTDSSDRVFVSNNQSELLVYDCISFHDFIQVNDVRNENMTILDLILINITEVSARSCDLPMVREDGHHPALEVTIRLRGSQAPLLEDESWVIDYRNADYNRVNDFLENVDWSILSDVGLGEATSFLYCVIFTAINMYIPRKRSVPLRFPTYFTKKTINLIKTKNNIYSKLTKTPTSTLENKYRLMRAQSKASIKSDYEAFLRSSEDNIMRDIKSFWRYLKSKRCTSKYPKQMKLENKVSVEPADIADLFAEFFESVYSKEPVIDTFSEASIPYTNVNLNDIEITSDIVFRKLIDLDTGKGPGHDSIPPLFLWNCSPTLALPLSIIFNRSVKSGAFPEEWKLAVITPIHKDGDRASVNNYRPISGLCSIAKVFESIVADSVTCAFRGILSDRQHGFLEGRSCETNLVVYSGFLSNAVDSTLQVDSVYFDFRKAFDTVDHCILLKKLKLYGIGNPLHSWIESYLKERKQVVRYSGRMSREIQVRSGVPQGSHLGPILFLIFVNDIGRIFRNSEYLLFADDLKLFRTISSHSDCVLLQRDIGALSDWCTSNNMSLNLSKCNIISFTRKRKPIVFDYFIGNSEVTRVGLVRDLGVLFDSELRFINHIDNITSRAFRMAGFVMRQCWEFNNVEAIKSAYFGLVRSHLEYCCEVWSPFYRTHIKKLERVQSRFTRFMIYKLQLSDSEMSYEDRLRVLGIDNLRSRRELLSMSFGHKIISNKIDCPDLLRLINFRVPARTTRQTEPFLVNASRTDVGRNEPINRLMGLLNDLPAEINLQCDSARFKRSVRTFLASSG